MDSSATTTDPGNLTGGAMLLRLAMEQTVSEQFAEGNIPPLNLPEPGPAAADPLVAQRTAMADAYPQKQHRVKFDPTINLGHVLTFVGLVGTGVLAYGTLAERVTVQERVANERAQQTRESLTEIKGDIRDLRSAVQRAINVPDTQRR